MLGAFCAVTGAVGLEELKACAAEAFGEKNARAVQEGHDRVHVAASVEGVE